VDGRVLGVDPGFAHIGWGIVDFTGTRHRHVEHGSISSDRSDLPARRLLVLYNKLNAIIDGFNPVALGIETLYFLKNVSSAMSVAQARGVILLAAAERDMMVGEYSPLVIKQSVVGSGRARKTQVQEMVKILLGLSHIPKPDHAADALAAAITFIHHGGLCSTASEAR